MDKEDRRYVETSIRVRYADTDRMGIVYYGIYPSYFEVGRSEYLRKRGLTYRELEEMGYFLVVTELSVRYIQPATYDDLLTVRTYLSELRSRGLKFEYEILRDGTLLVTGYTRHVCVDSNRRPVSIPAFLMEILRNG